MSSGPGTLFLSPMSPWPPTDGGRIRVRHLARGARRLGPVTVLALERNDIDVSAAVDDARTEGIELLVMRRTTSSRRDGLAALRARSSYYLVRYADPDFAHQLVKLRRRPWRIIQAEFSFMASYQRVAASTPGLRDVPWILDEHNIEWVISERLGSRGTLTGRNPIYRLYRARERRLRKPEEIGACRDADLVCCVSRADADALKAVLPDQRYAIVPNGVELDDCPFSEAPNAPPTAVFIAKMDYRPNVDAALWFRDSILPLVRRRHPNFRFRVIGPNPPRILTSRTQEGIEVTGWVDDPRQDLRAATMAVVPLRAGGGTRLKILEAMALGRPVVSTAIGAEGIEITPGIEFECADEPRGFAEAICGLIEDKDKRVSMGLAARGVAEQRYSWDSVVAAQLDAYDAVLESARTPLAARRV